MAKQHQGGVIAFSVPDYIKDVINLESYGFEPAHKLHITLAYIFFRDLTDKKWFFRVTSNLVKVGYPPSLGTLTKLMTFDLRDNKNEEYNFALVLGVNIFQIYNWRNQIIYSLKDDDMDISNKFNPHITLAYYNDKSEIENIYSKFDFLDNEENKNHIIDFGRPEIWINDQIIAV